MQNRFVDKKLETKTQGNRSEAKTESGRSVPLWVSPRSRDEGNSDGCHRERTDGSTKNRNDDGHQDENDSTK
jgi:hypothetical protein